MKKYYPYKSDKAGKKFYIITNDNKKYILALLDMNTIQKDILMSVENGIISADIGQMKIGVILILLVFGPSIIFGLSLHMKKPIKKLKNNSIIERNSYIT